MHLSQAKVNGVRGQEERSEGRQEGRPYLKSARIIKYIRICKNGFHQLKSPCFKLVLQGCMLIIQNFTIWGETHSKTFYV